MIPVGDAGSHGVGNEDVRHVYSTFMDQMNLLVIGVDTAQRREGSAAGGSHIDVRKFEREWI